MPRNSRNAEAYDPFSISQQSQAAIGTPPARVPESAKQSRYEGFENSATFLMDLYLSNSQYHFEELKKILRIDGSLDPMILKAYVEHLPLGRRIEMDNWAEGEVNWPEVTESLTERWFEQEAKNILPDFLRELAEAEIDGNNVRLVRKLDRKLYLAVDNILQMLGGKWNRKLQVHVFKDNPTELIETVVLTGVFPKRGPVQDFGYFPTPDILARKIVQQADIRPGMRVLEPSAGQAAIADRIVEIVGHENIVTIEFQAVNAKILRDKGYDAQAMDFLEYKPENLFPRIVMNPPFAPRQADIDHVNHAWSMLEPGGRLVSIMASSVTFRDNKKTNDFRELVEAHGSIAENEPGSFKCSGTNVNTVTVTLDKPT